MRIISVVTLIDPDGAYGGPTRVALNQAAALGDLGHDVIVAAGTRGFETPPRSVSGVRTRLFPAHQVIPGAGFAGLTSPGLLRWLRGAVRSADVVHVHAARDLVTLPAAVLASRRRVPYVLQTHGMIDPSTRRSARLVDVLMTRPVLRGARAVLYLTPRERADLLAVNGADLPMHEVLNGVPVVVDAPQADAQREVLYLARLQARKRPAMFVEAAERVRSSFPDVRFTLVGPDEGEGSEVERRIRVSGAASWEGPLAPEATLARMARASLYVLPSVDEPFPMSVLEAMSVGRPVVITESCGLAPFVAESGAGVVVDESLDALVNAIASLLRDPAAAARCGSAGREAVRNRLSMGAVAARLLELYRP